MPANVQKGRSNGVKLVNVLFNKTKCQKCGSDFIHEKMWQVSKPIGQATYYYYYCTHCFPKKHDVFEEVRISDS